MTTGRKIDKLTTPTAECSTNAGALESQIQSRASAMRTEVEMVIAERIRALEERKAVLLQDVDTLEQEKVAALRGQVDVLAASGETEGSVVFVTDAVMTFDILEGEDILPKIPEFGLVGEASTYPDKCTAAGPALVALKEGRPSFFWVSAFDRVGARRTRGGDTVEVSLNSTFEDVKTEDMKDGRYKISFLPTETGTSECAVTINGEMMAGFPLSITVRPPTIYPEIGMKGEKAIYSTKGEDMGAVDSPVGAVLDPSCTQCVLADSANHRIQVFDVTTGNALCSYGVHGKNAGEFSCPSHVCVLQQGTSTFTCVTDMLNHRVQIFEGTTTGKFLRAMGTKGGGDGQLLFPRGVAANEDGELYVCDQGNHRMCVFNAATGACVRKFGGKGTGPGQFNTPIAVTVDMDGRVLVTDKNHRVQVFDKLGTFLDQWGKKGRKDGEFNYPSAIAVDDEGSVFVCDSSNRRVQIFGPDGKPKHKWGGSKADVVPAEGEEGEAPPAEAEGEEGEVPVSEPWNGMKKPMGIALARDGTIWVVDHEKNQILVY